MDDRIRRTGRPRAAGAVRRFRAIGRDRCGIEAVADALMYLAIMALASAAVFALFPPTGGADPAVEQERLMDGARWAALALAGADSGGNGTFALLLGGGAWFDAGAVGGAMDSLIPDGYAWNVTWSVGGTTASAGAEPHGSVGSHAMEIGDGTLLVRVFRK